MIAKIKKTDRNNRGQLIIEAIIASSVLIVGFMGSLALLARAFRYNRIVTDNYVGTYLAAEGVEITKNIIDHNTLVVLGCGACTPTIPPCPPPACSWLSSFTSNTDYQVSYDVSGLSPFSGSAILYDSASGLYGYTAGSPTNYIRRIHVTFGSPLLADSLGNPLEIEVQSIVTWTTGFWSGSATLVDKFYQWRY